jgi:catechol 2,3-dioxygenase-like lactoylglutathione lyase family enzyme
MQTTPPIHSISAVTLATHDMSRAVKFYCALGFGIRSGGEGASFTSFEAGPNYLNLIAEPAAQRWSWWGRVIFYVSDVDAMYARAIGQGLHPDAPPRDAEWGALQRVEHWRDANCGEEFPGDHIPYP